MPYWRRTGQGDRHTGFRSRASGLCILRLLSYSTIVCVFWVSRFEFRCASFERKVKQGRPLADVTATASSWRASLDIVPSPGRREGFLFTQSFTGKGTTTGLRVSSSEACSRICTYTPIARAQGRWCDSPPLTPESNIDHPSPLSAYPHPNSDRTHFFAHARTLFI